jgi:hypothetical protein
MPRGRRIGQDAHVVLHRKTVIFCRHFNKEFRTERVKGTGARESL